MIGIFILNKMSFNGSFGEGEFIDDEDNSNILSLKQEDFKINFDERTKSKFSNIKSIVSTSNDITLNSNTNNNLFNSLFPNEIKINFQNQKQDNYYYFLLSKELLKYHLANLFNILKSKIIIINTQTFYSLKIISSIKINNLIKCETLYLKFSSNLNRFLNIFQKRRKNILFQVFYSLKTKLCVKNNILITNNDNLNFIHRHQEKYKKEKDKMINDNNNNIKQLQNDIKNIENKIDNLTNKENKLMTEINGILKKEKQLSYKINNIENSNNTSKKSTQIGKISSITPISIYDSDIHSLENTIEANKQLRKGKEEIIKLFMEQVNGLIIEYQECIGKINKNDKGIKNNNIDKNRKTIDLNENSYIKILYDKVNQENCLCSQKIH